MTKEMNNKELLEKYETTIMKLMIADSTEKEMKLDAIMKDLEAEILKRMEK